MTFGATKVIESCSSLSESFYVLIRFFFLKSEYEIFYDYDISIAVACLDTLLLVPSIRVLLM